MINLCPTSCCRSPIPASKKTLDKAAQLLFKIWEVQNKSTMGRITNNCIKTVVQRIQAQQNTNNCSYGCATLVGANMLSPCPPSVPDRYNLSTSDVGWRIRNLVNSLRILASTVATSILFQFIIQKLLLLLFSLIRTIGCGSGIHRC